MPLFFMKSPKAPLFFLMGNECTARQYPFFLKRRKLLRRCRRRRPLCELPGLRRRRRMEGGTSLNIAASIVLVKKRRRRRGRGNRGTWKGGRITPPPPHVGGGRRKRERERGKFFSMAGVTCYRESPVDPLRIPLAYALTPGGSSGDPQGICSNQCDTSIMECELFLLSTSCCMKCRVIAPQQPHFFLFQPGGGGVEFSSRCHLILFIDSVIYFSVTIIYIFNDDTIIYLYLGALSFI